MSRAHWRIHIVSMTDDQADYYVAIARWLRQQGHAILTAPAAPLARRLDAARAADLCLVLLGAQRGAKVAASSFSVAELEVSAAQDSDPGKVLVFAQPGVELPDSPEQDEFIQRLRNFAGGTFQATCATPAACLAQLAVALRAWQPLAQRAAALRVAPYAAVMISSTGDLLAERQAMRAALTRQRLPVIDYQTATSEAVPPVDRVMRWAGESRALFLILGTRYGYISPIDGLGVTELEFATALRAGRPILAFLRADATTTADLDQQQFVARVRHFVPADQIVPFADAADLARQLPAQVARLPHLRPAPPAAIAPSEARAWHRRHLRRWLGTLPVPGRPETLPLDDLPLLLSTTVPDPLASPGREWLGGLWSPEHPLDIPTYTAEEACAAAPRMLLLGGPGSGKSTVLRWYALATPADTTPIFLSLPQYARLRAHGQLTTLREYIQYEEARLLLAPSAERSLWLEDLASGRAILLLDAFDAVPLSQRATIAAEVRDLAAALPAATRVIVAARTGSDPLFDGTSFARYFLAPLNQGQQQILIVRWIQARYGASLSVADQRKRVRRLLFQLRVMRELADWARSPLLLGLYTAVNDQGADTTVIQPQTATAIYRRVLRALLEQGAAPRHVHEKEALLLALAQRDLTTSTGTGTSVIAPETITAAWRFVPDAPSDPLLRDDVVNALCERNGLLVRQPDGYSLLSPSFWSYLRARALAAAPAPERLDYVARRRLAESESSLVATLVGELDWYARHAEADQIIRLLMACDDVPLFTSGVRDPFHLALSMATDAQGVRLEPHLSAEPGPALAHAWEAIWREREYGLRQTTVWRFFILGPAATLARACILEALRDDPHDLGMSSGYQFAPLLINRLAAFGVPWAMAERERLTADDPPEDPDMAVVASLDATLDELGARLDHPNPKVRRFAAMNLRKFGRLAQPHVPRLIPLLADLDTAVCFDAAAALRGMNVAAVPALDALVTLALREPDMFGGGQAYGALRNLGPLAAPCLPRIAAALRGADAAVRANALYLVNWLGAVAQPLAEVLTASVLADEAHRATALRALSATGASLEPILDQVRLLLHDPDAMHRRDGLRFATDLRDAAAPLLAAIVPLLADADTFAQLLAFQAIGAMGSAAADACAAVRARLADPNSQSRRNAIDTLGKLGPSAWPAVDQLCAALGDGEWVVRLAAVEALDTLRPPQTPELIQALVACLSDEQKLVSESAFGALCKLRPLTPPVLDHLLRYQAAYRGDDRVFYFSRLLDALKTVTDASIPATLLLDDLTPVAAKPTASHLLVPAVPRRRWWFRTPAGGRSSNP
jgi:hypothetical protein